MCNVILTHYTISKCISCMSTRTVDAALQRLRARRALQSRLRSLYEGGAARSAALLAAGGLSALPAIYRFVRQVIDEVDAFNQAAETAEPSGETS